MKRLFVLLLAVVAGCARPAEPTVSTTAIAAVSLVEPDAACRIGPDDGPMTSERGIGGTGQPAATPVSDRGIGGTGIVGVISGFASICIDGLEVGFGNAAVDVDGKAASPDQLRAGQVAVVTVTPARPGSNDGLQAETITVRHEVSGPVEQIDPDGHLIVVAGQRVFLTSSVLGAAHLQVGDWATVSGLRQGGGTIVASRVDRTPYGVVTIRGRIDRVGQEIRIGGIVLLGPVTLDAQIGSTVIASGNYSSSGLRLISIASDKLASNPAAYFPSSVRRLVVEAFVRGDRRSVVLNNRWTIPIGLEMKNKVNDEGFAIVTLERNGADEAFTVTALHYMGRQASSVEISFDPVIVPALVGGPPDGRPQMQGVPSRS